MTRISSSFLLGLCVLAAAVPAQAASSAKPRLNDTGLTQCVVFDPDLGHVFTPECAGTGHDGEFGRDAVKRRNRDGHAGFSFEKIGPSGEPLPASAPIWSCVRDLVTGAMWEVKTSDGGPRDASQLFTNQGNGQPNDASGYVAAVNAAQLCGASDWRLPTRREAESLLDFSVPEGGPLIDTGWFPHSAGALHWTSTSAEVNGGSAAYRWVVNFYAGGAIWYGGQFGEFAVRLVRDGTKLPARRWVAEGAEVKDKSTGLVWRRCAEGQAWTGSTCSGTPATFLTVGDAVERAKAQAAATGQGWRAPNVKELSSLVDTRTRFPAIDRTVFPGFQTESYHTATHWTENRVYSWRISFAEGVMARDFWGGKLLLVRDAE
ncbi:MAG: DUF1566 domain-containing protein [Pseudomonadota bacterium]